MEYALEEFLLRYKNSVEKLAEGEREYVELRRQVYDPHTSKWDFTKTGGRYVDGSGMDRKLIKLEGLKKDIERRRLSLEASKQLTSAAIRVMDGRTETKASKVLRLYYVSLKTDREIAAEMFGEKWKNVENQQHLTWEITRTRKRGLARLGKLLPTERHYYAAAGVLEDLRTDDCKNQGENESQRME